MEEDQPEKQEDILDGDLNKFEIDVLNDDTEEEYEGCAFHAPIPSPGCWLCDNFLH